MLGEEVGEVDGLVGAPLRHHHHTPDLLHLGVVRGTHPVQVARYLTERVGGEGVGEGKREESTLHTHTQHTWVRRSDMMMNFFRTFLGRM